ncbi:hypothetical protein COCOBI_03-8320 [Coccomyxa sp. Obi]|nr:hypothetical protein COCOBI_03-8320 [Coccomyxa sp. Obi]
MFYDSTGLLWYNSIAFPASSAGASCINTTSSIVVSTNACSDPNCAVPELQQMYKIVFSGSSGSSGGSTPVAAPVTITKDVQEVAHVAVAVSTPALHFPSCSSPVMVVASVAGNNGTAPPSGAVTLVIIGANSLHIGAASLNVTLAVAPISGGTATFNLRSLGKRATAAQALKGGQKTVGAMLLPGSYQLTAAYSGDMFYGTASGSTSLDVGDYVPLSQPDCLTWQPHHPRT